MYNQRKGVVLRLVLVLMLVSILAAFVSCWGELSVPLQIENRTDMVLTIYVQGVNDGQVEPNENIKIKSVPGTLSYYLIEAKNSKEETVYSRNFSITELNDADWKVVILPSSIE